MLLVEATEDQLEHSSREEGPDQNNPPCESRFLSLLYMHLGAGLTPGRPPESTPEAPCR